MEPFLFSAVFSSDPLELGVLAGGWATPITTIRIRPGQDDSGRYDSRPTTNGRPCLLRPVSNNATPERESRASVRSEF